MSKIYDEKCQIEVRNEIIRGLLDLVSENYRQELWTNPTYQAARALLGYRANRDVAMDGLQRIQQRVMG